jgi:hypothetical protein
MISAASHPSRLPAMAFEITSWHLHLSVPFLRMRLSVQPSQLQRPIRAKGTDHVLIEADRSHANSRITIMTVDTFASLL